MIIYLTGFMGSGKSVVAKELRRALSFPMLDMDEEIERREKRSISEIFAAEGEGYFREVETAVLRDLSGRDILIIACGGGVILREENRRIMKESGTTVYLSAKPETIYSRVFQSTTRPLLRGKKSVEEIREMMEERRPYYEAVADLIQGCSYHRTVSGRRCRFPGHIPFRRHHHRRTSHRNRPPGRRRIHVLSLGSRDAWRFAS